MITTTGPGLLTARNSVALTFALNGLLFATWVSRLPDVRSDLSLTNSELGLLLITGSIGSVVALPLSGRIIERFKPALTVRGGTILCAVAVQLVAVGATVLEQPVVTALGLFAYGIGTSVWDVAMNVEGAEVERRLGRTIMPRFHAAWSFGSIAGGGIGIVMVAAHAPVALHFLVVGVLALLLGLRASGAFLPVEERHESSHRPPVSAWREPRTLLIGLMVLCFATVEGTANDWLTLAVIDGYDTPHWVGVAGFSTFVVAMTTGRLVGPFALDRLGRAPVLWLCAGASAVGVLIAVYGGSLPLLFAGVVIWGVGASLGFPVGMSAAADDPVRAAARVSAVATIGYGAFLIAPPLLGLLGDAVGTLRTLVVVAVLMVPASLTVFAARPPKVSGSSG